MIEAGETLWSEIHKLVNSIWSKEELPDQRKESIIVPVHKKGDKTDCSNYRGISLLSTSYKMLSKGSAPWIWLRFPLPIFIPPTDPHSPLSVIRGG
jgi:hypothetical protein